MNLTKHVKERFVERTMGYTDEQEIARYITLNEDILLERIMKLFDSSEKVYRGKIKDFETADTYINKQGWVFVIDYKKECIVTLYRIDLKVDDEELNRVFCEKMLAKINNMKQQSEEASAKAKETMEINKEELSNIEAQSKILNATLENLNKKKKNLDKSKENFNILIFHN